MAPFKFLHFSLCSSDDFHYHGRELSLTHGAYHQASQLESGSALFMLTAKWSQLEPGRCSLPGIFTPNSLGCLKVLFFLELPLDLKHVMKKFSLFGYWQLRINCIYSCQNDDVFSYLNNLTERRGESERTEIK